jgi:3-methyladenine DNA glycosylase/8-oxoguanine DNA glycosylase
MVLDAGVRQPQQGARVPGTTRADVVTTTIELPLAGPGGEPVDLWRTLNSHGFAELAPTRLDEEARVLEVTLRVRSGKPRRVRIGQGRRGRATIDILGHAAGPRVRDDVAAGVRHVLRLDQDLSRFYASAGDDPDLAWATSGAGRMLQSATVFEDVVKTVCTTNCAWSATVRMVNALVEHLGDPALGGDGPLSNAFPAPDRMAAAPERFYRDVVRAGYRGAYLIALARSIADGELDLEALATTGPDELPDADLEQRLLAIPGVGPYAAAHIMMTIGRSSRLILDSWTRPKYARLMGKKTVGDAQIRRRFRRYGDHAGLAFWLFVTRDWVD